MLGLTCREETLIRLVESKLVDRSSCEPFIGLLLFFIKLLLGSGLNEKARLNRLFALCSPLEINRSIAIINTHDLNLPFQC